MSRMREGNRYRIGAGEKYPELKSLPPLIPGDTVEVTPGAYNECLRWTASGTADRPITIRGVGNAPAIIDGRGLKVTGAGSVPRALFQIEGNYYQLENLHFRNARNDENGAGIRLSGAKGTVIRRCAITRCEMGMMSNDDADTLIEFCHIYENGNPERFAGYAHNLYLHGHKTTVQFCNIHDAITGINFKSRGHFIALLYNRIANSDEGEVSLVDSPETAAPNSNVVLIGNLIVSKADRKGNRAKFIDFGQDTGKPRRGTLTLIHNTLVAGDARIHFLNSTSDTQIDAQGNLFWGSPFLTASGAENIRGSENWLQEKATVPGSFEKSLRGQDPRFVDPKAGNFHLRPDSPARSCVELPLHYPDIEGRPQEGMPRFEWTADTTLRTRPAATRRTAGAFESPR